MWDFLGVFVKQGKFLVPFTSSSQLFLLSFGSFFSFLFPLEGFFQHPKAVVHLWARAGVIPPLLDATDGTVKPYGDALVCHTE